jgi:hypothetical protein
MGEEITVIDDSDIVGWTASATRIGEVYMTSVGTMVSKVKQEVRIKRISRLNILALSIPRWADHEQYKTLHKQHTELDRFNMHRAGTIDHGVFIDLKQ